jgi:hypothetical protein
MSDAAARARQVTARALAALTATFAIGHAHAAPAAASEVSPPIQLAPPPAEPDPAVEAAGDANLASVEHRQGFTFGIATGGGTTIGFGLKDSVGRGGSLALRLGHVATRRTVITFEIDVTAVLHRRGTMDPFSTNTSTSLVAGAHYYASPSLWLRLAGGAGVYEERNVVLSDGVPGDVRRSGPAVVAGVGVDLFRLKWAVIGLELGLSGMIHSDGLLLASGLRVGVAFD